MNKEKVEGKVEQTVGKVKQGVGKAIGNQELANRGLVDQVEGAAKETWGNAKDAAQQIREAHQENAVEKSNETRERVSENVDKAKEKVKDKIEDFKQRHSA
jgi:uncharacterized protein YjbJ (UPF0337 family)